MTQKTYSGLLKQAIFLLCIAFILLGCAVGPDDAQVFLDAVNQGDIETANQFVCQDKRDDFVADLSKKASIIAVDQDVLGLKSPGIKEIECQKQGNDVVCTFLAPSLLCSGLDLNNLLADNPISCTSFDPAGTPTILTLEISQGKFCGFTVEREQ